MLILLFIFSRQIDLLMAVFTLTNVIALMLEVMAILVTTSDYYGDGEIRMMVMVMMMIMVNRP